MIALETIRMLLVILVAITINQPEWLQEFLPEEDPVLVIMHDVSVSMTTQDVTDDGATDAKTRSEWVQPILDDEMWAPFKEKIEVVVVPFSSDLRNQSKGTDLNSALASVNKKHKNLRGVVMLTDGDWNIGDSPTVAATQLRLREVPCTRWRLAAKTPCQISVWFLWTHRHSDAFENQLVSLTQSKVRWLAMSTPSLRFPHLTVMK